MKAIILAAGRGERMRPLTDHTPKPLLKVAGKPLIEHTITALINAGLTDIVINIAHLGTHIKEYLADGKHLGASLQYSDEADNPLETAGGIAKALPLLGQQPFLVVNGDIATDFPFATLKNQALDLAHLVLIPNPKHHPEGDFGLAADSTLVQTNNNRLTYSGIGVYHPKLFNNLNIEKSKLGPLIRQAIEQHQVTGELFKGFWMDIGTPQRLQELDTHYQQRGKHHV